MTIINKVSSKTLMPGITAVPDVPDAPTGVSATDVGTSRAYNNGSATVSFTPAATGGGSITSYTATSSPGSFTASGASSPLTVTGLSSATAYTYAVTATNASATGPASSSSSSVTATTVPQAPTIGTASVTNSTTVSIPFTEGATGGSSITSYTATSSPSISLSVSGTSSPLTVTGTFATSQAYTFTISAVNTNGTSSASSASNSVTPKPDPSFIVSTTSPGTYGFRSVAVNQSTNTEYYGSAPTSSSNMATLVLNNSGTSLGSPSLSSGNSSWGSNTGIGIDSSNNWYLAGGYPQSGGSNNSQAAIFKYNSSNTLQWTTLLDYGSTDSFYSLAVGSTGNCYATGYRYNTGTSSYNGIIAKCNSSGAGQWSYYTSNTMFTYGAALDSSENFYFGTYVSGYATVSKLNSSGSEQWSQRLTTANTNPSNVAVDSSGNVYFLGYYGTPSILFIMKLNSSGAITWQRTLGGANNTSGSSIKVDSSGNVYVLGYTTDAGVQKAVIAKYNSSGTIQWQRFLGNTNNTSAYAMDFNSSQTYLCIAGQSGAFSNSGFAAKLPTDGSKTGTYTVGSTSWTYAAGNLTDSAGSLAVTSTNVSWTSGNALSTTTNPDASDYSYSTDIATL